MKLRSIVLCDGGKVFNTFLYQGEFTRKCKSEAGHIHTKWRSMQAKIVREIQ